MASLGLTTKHKVDEGMHLIVPQRCAGISDCTSIAWAAVILVDFLHFIDAVIEGYGDPFYDLRYRCVAFGGKAWMYRVGSPINALTQATLPANRRSEQQLFGRRGTLAYFDSCWYGRGQCQSNVHSAARWPAHGAVALSSCDSEIRF